MPISGIGNGSNEVGGSGNYDKSADEILNDIAAQTIEKNQDSLQDGCQDLTMDGIHNYDKMLNSAVDEVQHALQESPDIKTALKMGKLSHDDITHFTQEYKKTQQTHYINAALEKFAPEHPSPMSLGSSNAQEPDRGGGAGLGASNPEGSGGSPSSGGGNGAPGLGALGGMGGLGGLFSELEGKGKGGGAKPGNTPPAPKGEEDKTDSILMSLQSKKPPNNFVATVEKMYKEGGHTWQNVGKIWQWMNNHMPQ